MAAFIYLTTNVNNNEPKYLKDKCYVHVKAYSDGSQTLILSETELIDPSLTPYTFDEAQSLLDGWSIVDQKMHPDEDPKSFPPINLNMFIKKDEVVSSARIESYKQRCERTGSFENDEHRQELVDWAMKSMPKAEWQLYFDQIEKNVIATLAKAEEVKEVAPVDAQPADVAPEVKFG